MPETIQGDNAAPIDRNAELAALKADVQKIESEAKSERESKVEESVTADTKTQASETETPKETKSPEGETETKREGKDKSGEMSEEQIQKGIEHLKKDLTRKETLLKEYKELQKKYTPVSQEVKRLEKEVKPPEAQGVEIPTDFRKKFGEDLEKDPVAAIYRLVEIVADSKVGKVQPEIENLKDGFLDTRRAKEIDDLVEEGNDWILKEGLGRFDGVFAERPWLLQSRTPYKDAMKFLEGNPNSKRTSTSPAQGGRTPILSASGAVPPPVSQTKTVESDYQALDAEFNRAMERGDVKKAKAIQSKMGALLGQR